MMEDLLEASVVWFLQYGLFVAGGLMVVQAVLAWSGRWRSWAPRPPAGLTWTTMNYFPFTVGVFGLALIFFGLSIHADVGTFAGPAAIYDALGAACAVISCASLLWWPSFLTPGWHRDWMLRCRQNGGKPFETDPWPSAEERREGHR